LFKVN